MPTHFRSYFFNNHFKIMSTVIFTKHVMKYDNKFKKNVVVINNSKTLESLKNDTSL